MGKFVNFVGYETINPTTGGIRTRDLTAYLFKAVAIVEENVRVPNTAVSPACTRPSAIDGGEISTCATAAVVPSPSSGTAIIGKDGSSLGMRSWAVSCDGGLCGE